MSDICLIIPDSINDEYLYITKIMNNYGVKELRFTSIYETSPEARLGKLVKRNRLEEAEAFASVYGLSQNIIKKARAQMIVDKLICNGEDISALLVLLDQINDFRFTLQCCLDVYLCCDRLDDVKTILEYGCKELTEEVVRTI